MRADPPFQGGAFSSSGGRFFFVRGALFFFKGGPFKPMKNAQLNSGGLKPPGIKIARHNYEKQGYLGQGIYVHIFRYFLMASSKTNVSFPMSPVSTVSRS